MGFVSDLWEDVTGQTAADASRESAGIQAAGVERGIEERRLSAGRAQEFLSPFQQLGESGIEQAGFLTDPQAQFDFLQQNPLFQQALQQAQTGTQNIAAARGRLSAGDTLQQLSQNVLLSAAPLISEQKRSISDLLNIGTGIAGGRANIETGAGVDVTDLITSGAATEAAGTVGAAQARTQGSQNLLQAGLLAGAIASDKRLKENIKKIASVNGYNIYSWAWNAIAKTFGLTGNSFGVIAQEVMQIKPEAVVYEDGILKVNYEMIGVPHGR